MRVSQYVVSTQRVNCICSRNFKRSGQHSFVGSFVKTFQSEKLPKLDADYPMNTPDMLQTNFETISKRPYDASSVPNLVFVWLHASNKVGLGLPQRRHQRVELRLELLAEGGLAPAIVLLAALLEERPNE